MPQKTKYDRNALYFEFLTAEEESIPLFLVNKWVLGKEKKGMSWQMKKKISGRLKKKEAFKKKIMDKAIEKMATESAKKLYTPDLENLSNMHKKSMQIMTVALNEMATVEKGTNKVIINPNYTKVMKELEKVWKIIKVEKWEPVILTKNENNNDNTNTGMQDLNIIIKTPWS